MNPYSRKFKTSIILLFTRLRVQDENLPPILVKIQEIFLYYFSHHWSKFCKFLYHCLKIHCQIWSFRFRIHLAVNATIAELQHMRQAGSLGGVGHGVEGVVVVVVVATVGLVTEDSECYSHRVS